MKHISKDCPGAIRCTFTKKSEPRLTYYGTQSVLVSVEQNGKILTSEIVTGIDQAGRQSYFEFVYNTVVDPVLFIIQSAVPNQQFYKDNPVVVTDLVLDELFEIKFFQHNFDLICDGEVIDRGNVLYRHGRLVLTLNLPMVGCAKILTRR